MATEILRKVWDDLALAGCGFKVQIDEIEAGEEPDKVEAAGTLSFIHDSILYEIDLIQEYIDQYGKLMELLVKHARRPEPRRSNRDRGYEPSGERFGSVKDAVEAARKATGGKRGMASPLGRHNEKMREWFIEIGEPIKSYTRPGTNKSMGYKYKAMHYRRYNEHLRETGREAEILINV
jgi:hypothetical protein